MAFVVVTANTIMDLVWLVCVCVVSLLATINAQQVSNYDASPSRENTETQNPNDKRLWDRTKRTLGLGALPLGLGSLTSPQSSMMRPPSKPTKLVQECEGPNNIDGRCLPMEECVIRDINKDYVKHKEYFCVLDKDTIGVCCPNILANPELYREGMFDPPVAMTQSTPLIAFPDRITSSSMLRPSPTTTFDRFTDDITEISNEIQGLNNIGDYRVCGRNGKIISRITGGQKAKVKDWPWMAALIRRQDLVHFCGGSIITRRHILTAAHCLYNTSTEDTIVRLGDHDLTKANESNARDFDIAQIRLHAEYDTATYENDIAIIVIKQLVDYNTYMQPVCLPPPGPRYVNTTAIVIGWGTLSYGGPASNVLMEVPIPVWPQDQCESAFAQAIFDQNLCAGAYEGGKDSCQGDSGGPLTTQQKDGRWIIIGTVSWGIGCGSVRRPGVYIRVNEYLDWIGENII